MTDEWELRRFERTQRESNDAEWLGVRGNKSVEKPHNPVMAEEQPVEPSKEDLVKLFQAAVAEFSLAQATVLNGTTINPILIVVQQQVEILRLNAVLDELLAEHVIDDKKLTMRMLATLAGHTAELRKPQIANLINHAKQPRRS